MNARTLFALAGAIAPALPVLAQFDAAWKWNRHDIFVSTTGAITTTRGYEFTVSSPVSVEAIGVFDDETDFGSAATALSFPGLAQAHQVALWNLSNQTTPIATATVSAGQSTPLCQDGYRYAVLGPVAPILQPGQTYVVSAFWPGDTGAGNFDPYPDVQSSNAPVTLDPRITLGQARHLLGGGPNQFPSSITGNLSSYIGILDFRLGPGSCEPNPNPDLISTFRGGNGQAGNMFDLTSLASQPLTVTSWQINLNNDMTNATPVAVSVYWRTGTFVGHESAAAGWNLLGTVNVLSWGANQGTPVPVGGLSIPAGQTVGVFITTGFITGQPPPASPPFLNYSNIPPALTQYANADLRISGGVGKANPLFTGATFASKMWNGGVIYTLGGATPCYPNCDNSTIAPILNVQDFSCFLNSFANGETYANCDNSTIAPVLNVQDFSCFLNSFAVGCS